MVEGRGALPWPLHNNMRESGQLAPHQLRRAPRPKTPAARPASGAARAAGPAVEAKRRRRVRGLGPRSCGITRPWYHATVPDTRPCTQSASETFTDSENRARLADSKSHRPARSCRAAARALASLPARRGQGRRRTPGASCGQRSRRKDAVLSGPGMHKAGIGLLDSVKSPLLRNSVNSPKLRNA